MLPFSQQKYKPHITCKAETFTSFGELFNGITSQQSLFLHQALPIQPSVQAVAFPSVHSSEISYSKITPPDDSITTTLIDGQNEGRE
jgi:hypothetical protein